MIAVLLQRTVLCGFAVLKIARSVQLNSSQLANFSCPHINEVVKTNCQQSLPVAYLKPDLERFVASESLKTYIKEVINGARSVEHVAMQVSDTMFCAYGPGTASIPWGFAAFVNVLSLVNLYAQVKIVEGLLLKPNKPKRSQCAFTLAYCAHVLWNRTTMLEISMTLIN